MPITQFGFETPPVSKSPERPSSRNDARDQLRTHSDEGGNDTPMLDAAYVSPRRNSATNWHRSTPTPVESREQLIQRLKRERKSFWVDEPNTPTWPQDRIPDDRNTRLLPAVELREDQAEETKGQTFPIQVDPPIERPKSALHSGDFWKEASTPRDENSKLSQDPDLQFPPVRPFGQLSTSPTTPWYTPTLPSLRTTHHPPQDKFHDSTVLQARSRAASYSSLSSSFVFRPPTSPLAQQSNSNDVDEMESSWRSRSRSPTKNTRRRTFSPATLRPQARPPPSFRREETVPSQAHQPRRSLTNIWNMHSTSVPQFPFMRSRKASLPSDVSPMQHAPMVGGYEESILRGRMSTPASKPLDFVAQIGVLGKGNCKSNLKCPPHISIPFPAVFYNYGNQKGVSATVDGPSPYVGHIDLEDRHTGLGTPQGSQDIDMADIPNQSGDAEHDWDGNHHTSSPTGDRRRHRRHERVSSYSKAPKGGYRIPEQGQLQIVIKNPNKTAVKLFLVPYDLNGMEAGQKTFLRQRSYSAGPIIDMPQSARKNLGTDRPEASLSVSDDPKDRPVLRYLIHLHICCPSKGRYYLYKSIRVVFANRVPDGKEKLRNEIQTPEPRFSRYNPEQEASARPRRSSTTIHPLSPSYGFASSPTQLLETRRSSITWNNSDFSMHEQMNGPFTFPKRQLPSESDSAGYAEMLDSPWSENVPLRDGPLNSKGPDSLTLSRSISPKSEIPGLFKDGDGDAFESNSQQEQQQTQGLITRQLRALASELPSKDLR